jgi:hypothetical protein
MAAQKKPSARTAARDEADPRVEEARMPERDPNKIYTRDGREVDLGHIINQDEDYTNLAAMGIIPPEGWVYEWRTTHVKNSEYRKGIVGDAKAGWTSVPASRHPGAIMPVDYEGPIVHDGQMLMERDVRAVALSRKVQNHAANQQLDISRSMTGLMRKHAPGADGFADFGHGAAQNATGVKITRTPMGDPNRNQGYNYTLDE